MKRSWRFFQRAIALIAVVVFSVWSVYFLQYLEIAAGPDPALFKIIITVIFAIICFGTVKMFISLGGLDRITSVVLNIFIFVIVFLFVFFLMKVSWPSGLGVLFGFILLIRLSLGLSYFNETEDYSLDKDELYKIENVKNLLLYAWWK